MKHHMHDVMMACNELIDCPALTGWKGVFFGGCTGTSLCQLLSLIALAWGGKAT